MERKGLKFQTCYEKKTKITKDEMWSIYLKIQEGDYSGRLLFDNMVFSPDALGRVKLIAHRLGFDVEKDEDIDFQVKDILNKYKKSDLELVACVVASIETKMIIAEQIKLGSE